MRSSTHPAKRPYGGAHSVNQSTITSFFPTSSPRDQSFNASNSYSSDAARSSVPQLPATVQSNLLSVGMRVRKSVPEGYKTSSHNAFTLFSDASPAILPPRVYAQSTYHGRRKELTPFCGIMKVGGLAQQGYTEDYEDVFEEDDVPPLSSQGSTISEVSIVSLQANKRRFEEEEEEDEEGEEGEVGWSARGEVSQRPRLMGMEDGVDLSSRTMAMPRTRRKGLLGLHSKGRGVEVRMEGQENMVTDFEDAQFLDYGWRGEEVDMRDV